MKTRKFLLGFSYILTIGMCPAQVGINTDNPEGVLDVVSTNSAIVLPRVAKISDVIDAVDGMMAYAIDEQCFKGYTGGTWVDLSTCTPPSPPTPVSITQNTYIKASNTDINDRFGTAMALSNDGNTLVVGAFGEGSNAIGINGNQSDNSATSSGAAYVYIKSGGTWAFEAYLKASNSEASDNFGKDVAISGDGNTIAVSATGEGSNATGVNGDQSNNDGPGSGAVYIFTRNGSTWTQEAYIKATNTDNGDRFGDSLDISDDGNTLVVGSISEDSAATGVNGDDTDNSATSSGAAYIYTRSGSTWSNQAYLKASNTNSADSFGVDVAISGDGSTVVATTINEDSNATGINGDDTDNSASNSGAAYVFTFDGSSWSQQAYIKASNSQASLGFGSCVAISENGNVLAISSINESSNATGVNGNQADTSASSSGAVYTFSRSGGTTWTQTAYIKASNTDPSDFFGWDISLNADGTAMVVSAFLEDSNATGINGDQSNNSASNSGACYLFTRAGSSWAYQSYIKASNTDSLDRVGQVRLSSDATALVLAGGFERSNATGINGDQTDNSTANSGAAYVFELNF